VAGAGMLYSRLSPPAASSSAGPAPSDPPYTRQPDGTNAVETGHER
jgi:hypothetical protein